MFEIARFKHGNLEKPGNLERHHTHNKFAPLFTVLPLQVRLNNLQSKSRGCKTLLTRRLRRRKIRAAACGGRQNLVRRLRRRQNLVPAASGGRGVALRLLMDCPGVSVCLTPLTEESS